MMTILQNKSGSLTWHFQVNYLRADGARKHDRRDLEVTKSEVKDGLIIRIHDIHIDQVLGIALLNGDEQLFLQNKNVIR